MAAAGKDNQTFIFHVYDYRLIVVNPWVGLPLIVDPGHLSRVSFLKGCRSGDLPGDKRLSTNQHRRRPILDDLDALGFQIALTGRNMLGFMPIGKDILSLEEGIRMENDRYPWPAVTFNQPDQTPCVIRMTVTEHDGMQLIGLYFQGIHIVQHAIDGYSGIEEK